jgi:ankyrin repeat protein
MSEERIMNIDFIAKLKTAEDFFKTYKESDGKILYPDGDEGEKSLLFFSLSNNKPKDRYLISDFLLDQGVDVLTRNSEGHTVLHVLLGHRLHDIKETVKLCERLIERGVDVGALDNLNCSIMQEVVNIGHESKWTELYDLLFAQTNLDCFTENKWGYSPYDLAVKTGNTPNLIERMVKHGAKNS